ncbi:MAG TPA: neutral/alkaline non-lysosomal ceramidase N-terminal domain-containing protein [Longilinea sp.]|nr:neutral/alkaline non-lysosomal ceramidase N-terminal domain-containing protein [Longilinea sp.]
MSNALLAGAARTIISPPKKIYTIGYGDRTKGNEGIHDDLTATALYLDDGKTKLAIAALDILCLNEFIVDRIRAAVGDGIAVIVCCSHTHSGPIGYADKHSGKLEQRYIDSLVENVSQAVKQAAATAKPAKLGWSKGEAFIAVNRREKQADGTMIIGEDPNGIADRSLQVLSVTGEDGARIATLVNFACHGTVFGPDNLLISADWIGVMRSEVEKELGGLGMFLQGATGNLNPKMGWGKDNCWDMAVSQGKDVAKAVCAAVKARVEPLKAAPLAINRREIWLPFRAKAETPKPPTTYRKRILVMAEMPSWLSFITDPLLNYRYPWKPRLQARDGRWATMLRVNTLRIGEVGLVTFGSETFTEIGLAIKEASPAKHTLFVSITDGCIGYLATEAAHSEGGYEVDLAPYAYRYPGPLAPEGETLACAAAADGLKELFK